MPTFAVRQLDDFRENLILKNAGAALRKPASAESLPSIEQGQIGPKPPM